MTHLQKQTFFCTLPSFHLRPFKTRGTVVARTTQDETDIADKNNENPHYTNLSSPIWTY